MSMDELLLQELYGSQQVQAEQQIKQAQVELVEAVAAQAGVDLNELDDEELSKFAHYVLSDEDEAQYDYAQPDYELDKLAEADVVGRQMAHSYADELGRIQETQMFRSNVMSKVASAMSDVADAWYVEKVANETATPPIAAGRFKDRTVQGILNDTAEAAASLGQRVLPEGARGEGVRAAVGRAEGAVRDAVGGVVGLNRDQQVEAVARAVADLAQGRDPAAALKQQAAALQNTVRAEGDNAAALIRQQLTSEAQRRAAAAAGVNRETLQKLVDAGTPTAQKKIQELQDALEPSLLRRAGQLSGILQSGDEKLLGARGGRLAATLGLTGALGYGGYRALRKDDGDDMNANEKVSMLLGFEKSAGMFGSTRSERIMAKLRQLGGSAGRATGVLRTRGEGLGKRSLRGAATLAGAAGLGYGGYRARRAMSGNEKVSMLIDAGYPALAIAIAHTPEEFAKEAEYRAAEILLAQGVDPATLEDVQPEYVKIASFPGVDEASDMDEAEALEEYNEMLNTAALHILDELLND